MGAMLDALHRLQTIENELRTVRTQVESKKQRVRGRERKVAMLERQIADNHTQIRLAQTEADRLELDRKSHEEHISRLRETLNKAKTNKEYAAVLTELNTDKARASKVEDTVLAALTRVDELAKAEADLRTVLEVEKTKMSELKQVAKAFEDEVAGRMQDLQAKRDAAAGDIPPEALNMFERACDRHDGEGMAMIERAHPKRAEYNCGGCNMSVTLEMVNALQTRDVVQPCQTCSRILCLEVPASAPV